MPATYFPSRWMVGTFQEILDSSSGNWVRIKSMTDLRVLSFAGSCEAKYSSTELNFGDFISFRLPFVDRFFIGVFILFSFASTQSPQSLSWAKPNGASRRATGSNRSAPCCVQQSEWHAWLIHSPRFAG